MISVNNLTIRFGNFELFSDIGFLINKRDRIGLVGKNGAGKSTLLKVINGDISPNEGNISVPTDIKIGYLPQQMILENAKLSVFEEARTAFQNVLEIQTEIDKLNVQIANYHDYTEDEYSKLIEKLTHLSEHLNIIGADNVEQNIEKVLKGLGFSQTDFQRKISEFSGGWKMRVELAKILLQNPDVILLDEPTNHLDIEAIQWLESFLET